MSKPTFEEHLAERQKAKDDENKKVEEKDKPDNQQA
ncbi:hypothetical protein SmaMPs15_000207 [Stenotrophomonas maltophilia phage vB_SmaM_Ps15]|uniref:Uncharacterized protein n=1 Tax=Stenotrophomonas maltophilia phage vB_SmaM_Ps15 TaxID=3071007 RepID=A0AAE9JUD0_9CAUD|nr:hypothetical protein PQC01_gp271 [Stenotrophomonas maltophilia phage vB_SmaM_Ps15]QXN67482.1 hypothetical protein [Stenotrophomonas phage BUCT608]QYC97620.1 hypothetical protein [Stenotrophomonas phage BUCT608]QYW02658.1 hypothetical protein CPT_Marzo_120 [Stenotrophomonas phage Marzo]UMO77358.1 hypothetical protein SmaMPs15_000207 [Stenotrophomonas maltophilia phage vB_SmaM_Ps15]